jgi:hypothetical protein
MDLIKEDLFSLGGFDRDDETGNTIVLLEYGSGLGVTKILLREILKLYGEYSIVGEYDIYDEDILYLACHTNLPWDTYKEVHKKIYGR